MISKKMEKALNVQIGLEGYASFLYLAMSAWCDKEGLKGCTEFMRRQSEEEQMHMMKIFDYVSEVDGYPLTPAIKQPPSKFNSIQKLFEEVYAHEQKVTKSIHKLVSLAKAEDDYTTFEFLQWYVMEQREEEDQMRTILDRIKIIGKGPQSLYFIDKEIEAINAAAIAREAEEGA